MKAEISINPSLVALSLQSGIESQGEGPWTNFQVHQINVPEDVCHSPDII